MANIQVSKPASAPQRRLPDVFDALHGEMDRVFRNFEQSWPRWPSLFQGGGTDVTPPSIDVHENTNTITIEADLPGLDEKDVSVTLANGVLTTEDDDQALARMQEKGSDCARAAVEMANLLKALQ